MSPDPNRGLVVEGLTVHYGRATALTDVSVTAPRGSVTAVVGPNGAGKSSLLLAIYGSVGSSGRVSVDGEDMTRLKSIVRARSGVAIVPQGRQIFPRLNVHDNLQVMAETLRLPNPAVDEAMDRFPILRERSRNLAGVLSGGEQQMLVVARALMSGPRVLLLDEMMTGLAPRIVQSLAGTVKELANDGVAVLLAEPSIGALRGIIGRGYVVIRGNVIATEEGGGRLLDNAYQSAMGVELAKTVEAEAALEAAAQNGGPSEANQAVRR
jgi:branched-chain amino acid transport system ATP-binding protein